jgi:hypothetical protein
MNENRCKVPEPMKKRGIEAEWRGPRKNCVERKDEKMKRSGSWKE